jgi:hypothetical protein
MRGLTESRPAARHRDAMWMVSGDNGNGAGASCASPNLEDAGLGTRASASEKQGSWMTKGKSSLQWRRR